MPRSPRPGSPDPALFDAPGWTKRRHERTADAVIRRLHDVGGWDHRYDLATSALRAAARAVDLAERVAMTEPAPYAAMVLAQTARELRETLAVYGLGLGGMPGGDGFDAFLAEIQASEINPPTT
jgi:hypothetical protein